MNEIIKRDPDFVTVGAAVTEDADQDVTMLRVDPSTGYLLMAVSETGSSSANALPLAQRDQNHVPVCLAWDETNGVLQEVLTDEDGNLLVDLLLI